MKKRIAITLMLIMGLAALAGCGKGEEKKSLKVYNAGEYINKQLLTDFETKFNCNVIYETFDSNESMYTKIMSGENYDVLIPSDYMIERLIKEDYLMPLDWAKIPNSANLYEGVKENAVYDPEHVYTAPYFWGTVGIIYDTTVVDAADAEAGWDLLTNTKYAGNIYMYDSERDSFMVALKALGYSMNTTDTTEIDAAYEWLVNQRDTMSPVYVGDDVIDNMISANKAMAVVYSGDAAYMITENPDLDFVKPSQGTNMWYDCMVLPKNCQEVDLAHEFINFMLDEENALVNTDEVGYSSSVSYAYEEMQKTTYEGISAYTPVTTDKDEVFRYQDTETKKYFADHWTMVKSY